MFGKKVRTPEEMVTKCHAALERLRVDRSSTKDLESVTKYFGEMRTALLGEGPNSGESAIETLVVEANKCGLAEQIVSRLPHLPFETRKDAATVFNCLVRTQVKGQHVTVDDLSDRPEILDVIARGYENPNVALTFGAMLRDMCRNETLNRKILFSDSFWLLFQYMQLTTFEIASDASATFREALTRHKDIASEFLSANYDRFMREYTEMLEKGNYVTRRQSLKLLGEILLDAVHVNSMLKYVAQVENLCLMMNLMRDESKSIQFEAFHIFKVFVANPDKPQSVTLILSKNKAKLMTYLEDFQADREDESFQEERGMLLKLLAELPDPE